MNALAGPASLADHWTAQLLRDGFCIIPDLVPTELMAELEADLEPAFAATPLCQGQFYGNRTKRFASLLKWSRHAEALVLEPTILKLATEVLGGGCDRMQLNVVQAIEIHPGEVRQFPHRDHDMWQCDKGAQEFLLNIIWPLTPFTADNGATLIYPGSHGVAGMAKVDPGEPVPAVCNPGSAICFLGSTAHGAGPNLTEHARRGIVVGYCLGWLKPYENQWLAYPPNIAKSFSPELADLVGYAQHRPNLGNHEGNCPSLLLADDPPEAIGAVDALRPDQQEMLAAFADPVSV